MDNIIAALINLIDVIEDTRKPSAEIDPYQAQYLSWLEADLREALDDLETGQ